MIRHLTTWRLIADSLNRNQPVMLLYVLESHGSSPGRQGFFMAVNAIGAMAGSIGGGIMEHKFVEMAKEKLRQESVPGSAPDISVRMQHHDKSAARNQSGMICSGDQTILLYVMQPHDIHVVLAMITCLEHHRNGQLDLSPEGLQFSADHIPAVDYLFRMQSETDWSYQEKLGYKNRLYIIGGGHCALALADLMSRLDFHISVFDDRPDLHTLGQNDAAHQKIIVADYRELTGLIPSGPQQYVVVMTVGYRTDDVVVRALLDKQFRYFGVLGSRAKIDTLLSTYRIEGIPDEKLQRLNAPVGLPIHSQTPEEIAVSIAGEIIRAKNSPLPLILP